MYEAHFGLSESPFRLTPDTGYFFASRGHQEALNTLLVALELGEGFIKVVGEVGTGKTLLCRKLLNLLSEQPEVVTAYLPNPSLNPTALRYALAAELGVSCPRNAGQHRLLGEINQRLIQLAGEGRRVVFVIDEAQSLPAESLEALRLLTNLETERSKLLQVVLFAQPELETLLNRPSCRQVRQRITFTHRLLPMDALETRDYLAHRLRQAGNDDPQLFTTGAQRKLYRASRGVPRLVNILAHKAMLAAYGAGLKRVGASQVGQAIRDTESVADSHARRLKIWFALLGIGVSSAALAGGLLALRGGVL